MIVSCPTIEEFLECLNDAPRTFENTVRVSIVKRPVGDRKVSVATEVLIQATTIVVLDQEDGSQYLLQTGVQCGVDFSDQGGEFVGTETAEEYKAQIVELAESKGMRVMPGVIGV